MCAARRAHRQGILTLTSPVTSTPHYPQTDRLVIFDCDGVLVDSELISCHVHAEVLTRHGYPITATTVRDRFLGRSARDANAEIERELGRPLPDAFYRERRSELLEALSREVSAVAHIHDALDAITVPVCVASSGAHDKIFATLSRTALHPRFSPHIFSATDVERGKPAPDLFLHAARQMGCPSKGCIVIEDSEAGVMAAIAAGMHVVGFVGGSHCRPGDDERLRALGAHVVTSDMRNLPEIIARHFRDMHDKSH